MSFPQFKPGARRTRRSCFTCRQWRVKCDRARPCCETCLKSGLECLGYGEDRSRTDVHQEDPGASIPFQLLPTLPVVPAQAEISEVLDATATPNCMDTVCAPRPSVLGAAALYRVNMPVSNNDDNGFDCSWPQQHIQRTPRPALSAHRYSNASNLDSTCIIRFLDALCKSIPPVVDTIQITREAQFVRIFDEYQLQSGRYCFISPPVAIRDSLITRLMRSQTLMQALFLSARLLHALSQDPGGTPRGYVGWIDQFENRFITDASGDLPLDYMEDRLSAQLELAYLRFVTADIISGYVLLQKALPSFLHLVAADSNLYSEHSNGNLVVSFPRALGAPQYELKRFIMYDTATALVLGVPPMVEYGYDGECDPTSHGLEWIHGIPVPLVQAISQINSWRAGFKMDPADDWMILEKRVLAWEPRLVVPHGQESGTESVARLAIQESWRHAVLIYIYMGMCGVSSHDSRVQKSIQQIMQLMETVANSRIGIHMFTHCLIAGIAARLERDRSIVRKKLLSFKNARVWLFRGPQFSRVLDHLWHGVGVGGAPVTWGDYVQSRCAVIPA